MRELEKARCPALDNRLKCTSFDLIRHRLKNPLEPLLAQLTNDYVDSDDLDAKLKLLYKAAFLLQSLLCNNKSAMIGAYLAVKSDSRNFLTHAYCNFIVQ